MSILQDARDTTINNAVLNNIIGDATIIKIDGTGPLSEEFKTLFVKHIAGVIVASDLRDTMEKHALDDNIRFLPHTKAAYNDYASSDKRRVTCLEGTREALLMEIAEWISASDEPQIYLLFGPAGFGKSTIAQTIAERADEVLLLGASFFFSRDEPERRNAEKLFTTIAFQLCGYNPEFAHAIAAALKTNHGSSSSKGPLEQLTSLIIRPLRDVVKPRVQPILIVIDALDECDDADALIVIESLNYLVRQLPCFKIVLTTRPQLHLGLLFDGPSKGTHKIFYLQNIEDKVIDDDIQRFLIYHLSKEQVALRLPNLRRQWNATDRDIELLTNAAGRLFIIASTTVRFILDTTECNPTSQLNALISHSELSLNTLERFYTVILRRAIPKKCKRNTIDRFKTIVGAILVIPTPLPIKVLERFTKPWSADDIDAVLKNLQSVIMLNEDTPRIYHKSFSDFLTDPELCSHEEFHIVLREQHTRMTILCLQIMNQALKRNLLDLDGLAQYKENNRVIKEGIISEDQLDEKIPQEVVYACKYWAHHLERADYQNADLKAQLEIFATEHLLHWIEALSWIGVLDMAHRILGLLMKLTSSSLPRLFSDAQRFVSRFFARIEASALHTYSSALTFTPTASLLHETYSKESRSCKVHGGPGHWDAMIADLDDPQEMEDFKGVFFSRDGNQLASHSKRVLRLWGSVSGTPTRTFESEVCALSGDFSTVALCWDATVTLRDVVSNAPIATMEHTATVSVASLSVDGSRLALGHSDGAPTLWDARTRKLVATLSHDADNNSIEQLEFSPDGQKLALLSTEGSLQLWDGKNGNLIATLCHPPQQCITFAFSYDSSRIASLATHAGVRQLTLWKTENGQLVGVGSAARRGGCMAISPDGSLLASAPGLHVVLWRVGSSEALEVIIDIEPEVKWVESLALFTDMLGVSSYASVKLYSLENYSLIAKLQYYSARSMAVSPDNSRFAAGTGNPWGTVCLWDVPAIKISALEDQPIVVTALALSHDCSRLAIGHSNGTVELWDITRLGEIISSFRDHSGQINAISFDPTGTRLVSGSWDGTVILWSGTDGAQIGVLALSIQHPTSISISGNVLAVSTSTYITLLDPQSLSFVDTLDAAETGSSHVSLSLDGSLLASVPYTWKLRSSVVVWDVEKRTAIATLSFSANIIRPLFSPDYSTLAVQLVTGYFEISNITGKSDGTKIESRSEDLTWLPVPRWGGFLISLRTQAPDDCLLALSPNNDDSAPMLWIPTRIDVPSSAFGASLFALLSSDGGILFIHSPSSSYSFPQFL